MLRLGLAALAAGALLGVTVPAAAEGRGHLNVVTYNVAGLPDGVMTAHPSTNMPLIGKLLGQYDLALVQEDFVYPAELRKTLELEHRSLPSAHGQLDFGDGLSQFARWPFSDYRREPWRACHGLVDSFFDCLTPKGFSYSRQTLTDRVAIDVYNLHLDAGFGAADAAARRDQIEQLIAAIQVRSRDVPVLVAGDTNIPWRQRDLLERLKREIGLEDACSALHCREPWRIDRVLFRGTDRFQWRPRSWHTDPRFVDKKHRPLSDHLAVAVSFDWIER